MVDCIILAVALELEADWCLTFECGFVGVLPANILRRSVQAPGVPSKHAP